MIPVTVNDLAVSQLSVVNVTAADTVAAASVPDVAVTTTSPEGCEVNTTV